MWGNAFFIAQIVSFCRGIVRYSFPRPGNGSRIVPLLRFCVKKEISAETRPGPVASRRAPLAPDTVFRGKKHKNYVAACDRIFSGIASFFKRTI